MSPHRCRSRIQSFAPAVTLSLLAFGLFADYAAAQPMVTPGLPSPRILIVTPCGGQAGSTVELTLSGIDLEEPQDLLFSTPGVKAVLLGSAAPPHSPRLDGDRSGSRWPLKRRSSS